MKKVYLLSLLVFCFSSTRLFSQGSPYVKIDNNQILADQSDNGLKLPAWLNAGQTLAADANVHSVSVLEFTVNGTQMELSQALKVTTVQTVPPNKVWKIESVFYQNPGGSTTAWNLTGNGNTTAGTHFVGTTDSKDLVMKSNNVEGLRLTPAGNVGIGNASPAAKLDVAGSVKIADGTQGANKVLTSDASGNASWQSSGAVLQVVYAEQTAAIAGGGPPIPFDNTIPQITEGSEFLTATITPKSASSFLLVQVVSWFSENTNTSDMLTGALFRDAGVNAIAAGFADLSHNTITLGAGVNNYSDGPFVLTKRVASGSTAPTTFRFRAGANAGPVGINMYGGQQYLGGAMTTTMTITEIN